MPITDFGYDLFIAYNGKLQPIANMITLAHWRTKITVDAANSNETTGNAVSVLKIAIPYNTNNGSMLGDGDTIDMRLTHERSAGGSGNTSRTVFIGSHATLPLNNISADKRNNTSTTNIYVPESPSFHRVNATTVNFVGRKSLDQWGGNTATDVGDDGDAVTSIPSMDANITYIDIVLRHASNVSENLIFNYGLIRLLSTGPVTG